MKSAITILLISLSTCECSTIIKVCGGKNAFISALYGDASGDATKRRDFDPQRLLTCYDIKESISDLTAYTGGFNWPYVKYGYTESVPWELYDETDYTGNRWVFTPGVIVDFPSGFKSLRPSCEYSSKG